MKVLLIEDNKADYVLIKNMIEEYKNEKIDLHWVSRLKSGIERAENEEFDIVLLDLGLPDSNGLETFETLYKKFNSLPIIILSGLEDEYIAIIAVRNGAQDYLAKNNLNPQILNRAMKYAIERKQTEDAIRESEEKFKVIFNESLDVIIIIDSYSGLIYNINPAAYSILGYKKKMLVGRHYSKILPEEKFFNDENFLSKVSINGAVFESLNFLKADGSKIPMDLSATIIPWGKNKAILVSLRDASERINVEKAISNLNRELEKRVVDRTNQLESTMEALKSEINFRSRAEDKLKEAKNEITKAWLREKELNELKTRFITMVSHEYRTPLSVISSSAEFLELYDKNENPDKFKKHLKKILNSVESMTSLLENVMIVEQINSAGFSPNLEFTHFENYLNAICSSFAIANFNSHTVKIEISYQEVDEIKIEKQLMKYVIFNLLDNAFKFSEIGSTITIDISIYKNELQMSVSDSGIGIKEEEISFVFEPFHKSSDLSNASGFGIGLHIVKTCLKVLRGDVYIDSKVGKGTSVQIRIPLNE